MRQPKNQDELFHYWANLVMPQAKCGNVSYDGLVLYSYAEPIAVLLSNNRVLISNRNFSVTTSSHQSAARSATRNMRRCSAPYLTRAYNDELSLRLMHKENREYWERQAENALAELKLHPRRKKSVADKIASAVASYNNYREFFELDWPEMTSDEMKTLVEERGVERAEEYKRAELRRAEEHQRREAEEAVELLFWRNHQTDRRSFAKTALRLSLDHKEIETTRGASVPVDVAPALWAIATKYRARQASTHFRDMRVGVYRLDSVDSDGALNIGCHHIPFDELALMAKQLNFKEYSNGIESDRISVDEHVCGAGNQASAGEHGSAVRSAA